MTRSLRPNPALAAAVAALVIATGGTAVAAKLITGQDIKNGTVTGLDVRNGSLTRADLRAGTTTDTVIPRKRVVATSRPTEAEARSAAPRVTLFRKGALTVYAKCFTDASGPTTFSEVHIRTSRNGAIFDSRDDTLDGGPTTADFLNIDSPETLTQLEGDSTGLNNSSMDSEDDSDFTAFAPGGTTMRGWTGAAVKNGTLAGGNGVFGAGDVCLFTGTVLAN